MNEGRKFLERRPDAVSTLLMGAGLGLLVVTLLGGAAAPGHDSLSGPKLKVTAAGLSGVTPSAALTSLNLGVVAYPHAICAYNSGTCPAGTGVSRVTLTANAASGGVLAWPAVQVAFVVETALYDGVYDPSAGEPGTDPCAASGGTGCEESNGVPFFVTHAQQIANAIATANPHSAVSFALVDYFSTSNLDDGDGAEYHVDLPTFVQASTFGSAVSSTFQAQVLGGGFVYGDSDFSDNMHHSSMITALYGTIIGSGLNWGNQTHHVIVWMGDTAPRDPAYVQDYCVSPSNYASSGTCYSSSCEPSYVFAAGTSPQCEGWVHSQDGNVTHSIAQLAKTSPTCTDSIGGVCTVDMIDLWSTPTDPYSKGWPAGRAGGGPGGTIVQQNVDRVLLAGCDMAAATGGTWDGPAFFTCPDGTQGSLQYVAHGSATAPATNNPTLFTAFRQVGFGPILKTQVAAGTGRPLFTYVPFGNIVLAPGGQLQATASCQRAGLTFKLCDTIPTVVKVNGMTYLGWNWSKNASTNIMYVGDSWTASFNVVATGPPFALVPVDACTTAVCHAGGSSSVAGGLFTWATYVPYTNNTVVVQSFPLGQVQVRQ
ncbi:MAG: hypothetical protein ACHQ2Y_09345, partial [Candidatus Lutacidiplasmatales archaeon]